MRASSLFSGNRNKKISFPSAVQSHSEHHSYLDFNGSSAIVTKNMHTIVSKVSGHKLKCRKCNFGNVSDFYQKIFSNFKEILVGDVVTLLLEFAIKVYLVFEYLEFSMVYYKM